MTHRHIRLVIALLLPLMVLRAMLPAGYMPVSENGSLRIALCSQGLYPAPAATGTDPAGGHRQAQDSGSCPFAHAAVNTPPSSISILVFAPGVDAGAMVALASPARSASLIRVQSARGPPPLFL